MAYCQSLPQGSAQSAYGRGACTPCLSAFDPFLGSRAQTTLATNAARATYLNQLLAQENAAEKKKPVASRDNNYWIIVVVILVLLLLGAIVFLPQGTVI